MHILKCNKLYILILATLTDEVEGLKFDTSKANITDFVLAGWWWQWWQYTPLMSVLGGRDRWNSVSLRLAWSTNKTTKDFVSNINQFCKFSKVIKLVLQGY